MKWLHLSLIVLIVQLCGAPPVSQKKEGHEEDSEVNGLEDYMEYHRYLKEIVNALESDPEFRSKLENADENDIKTGKIAEQLEFVSHHVRTRLDEIKRVELDRLKQLVEQKKRLEDPNSIDEDPMHHHLDHSNPHTFEIEDLKKLIAKTTADLAEADRKRKEQFKEYEMEKEFKKQDKLNHTNGEERNKLEKEYKEMEQKHKKHEKLHEPGHKAQLEEVWEEQDQMQQDFDPKTFFMLHDLDGNGFWDQDEVKALFIKELDKMYQEGAPEDDMRERIEEMERMRESVFREMDTNNDGFIDFNEFIRQTNTNDFKQDNGWQGLDEQRPFSEEEYAEYVRQHQAMNQIPRGYQQMPPPAGYQHQVPPGGYQQVPPGGYQQGYQQQVPPGGYQQAPQGYPQMPQGGYQQAPQGGYQQVPQGGYQQAPQVHQQAPQVHQQAPQVHQQAPQVHQQIPPGGYQAPQGVHQQPPQGYQQVPPGGYQAPQGGYQQQVPQQPQVPRGDQEVPQSGHQPQVVQPEQQKDPQQNHQQQQGQIHQDDLNTNEVNPPQVHQNVVASPQVINQANANNQHQNSNKI